MMQTNNIIIDNEKCSLCGNCTIICGANTLEIVENLLVQTIPSMCCSCGHCAAICPENAISSTEGNRRAFTVNVIDKNLTEFEKLILGKRSVREFKDREISKEIIENLIHYAEKSPSSSNTRKREYVVITDRSKMLELEKTVLRKFNALKAIVNPFSISVLKIFNQQLSRDFSLILEDIKEMKKEFEKGELPIFRKAPCVICIIAPKGTVQAKDDCIIAQQYMMLYAQSIGIGSCIIGYAQYAHKTVEKYLEVKKGYSIYAVSIFGYPRFTYEKEIQYLKKPQISWV